MKTITIKIEDIDANNMKSMDNPNLLYKIKYTIPFNISTRGYCIEIFSLQYLHLPKINIYESMGTLSYHLSLV